MFKLPGERHVAPLGPPLTNQQIRVINRGVCWNTSNTTKVYLRAAATDEEMADMRYPAQGFRTFRSVCEVKP